MRNTNGIRGGMICDVYSARANGDKPVKSILIIGTNIPEVFEQTPDMPTLQLIMQNDEHDGRTCPRLEPIENESRYAFGGSFAFTSDSRFPVKYPVKIFNRKMGKAEYNTF